MTENKECCCICLRRFNHIYGRILCFECEEEYKIINKIKANRNYRKIKESRSTKPELYCNAKGTCEILKVHHELLKDDPDRLSTKFLIKLICS